MKKKLNRRRFFPSIVWSLLFWTTALPAWAQTFHTTEPAEQVVHFYAQHTLGEVEGTLTPVTGTLTFNPSAPEEGLSGHFTADMTSFDTGLGLRDKDMRNKYLETEQHPEAVFSLDDAQPTLLGDSSTDTLRFAVSGALTLHGVTKDHVVEATLTPTPNGYHVFATFPLLLSDYDIPQPRRFFLTVQDEIRVEVRLNLE